MLKRTPLKPGKPLARSKKPMNRRAAPLAVVSKTGQKGKREQKKAYAGAPDAEQCWCSVCGLAGEVHHSHLLSQGNHKLHRNNPLNWLISCWDCHTLFEHKKREFAARHPDVWALIQDRILQVGGVQALAFFQLKNPF